MDAFDIFDAPPPTAEEPSAKRGKTVDALPSCPAVFPLCERFVRTHATTVCKDLAASPQAAAKAIGIALEEAAQLMRGSPPDLHGAQAAANQAVSAAWAAMMSQTVDVLPYKVFAKEAYVIGHIILCGVSAALDDDRASALRSLDHAFIFGGQTDVYRDCAELLDQPASSSNSAPTGETSGSRMAPTVEAAGATAAGGAAITITAVERRACPSEKEELREIKRSAAPIVLEGVGAGWPAMHKWPNLEWLRAEFGGRLVPVEVGSLAAANKQTKQQEEAPAKGEPQKGGDGGGSGGGWRETIMSLSEFIDAYLLERKDGRGGQEEDEAVFSVVGRRPAIGYLAQHPLFEQLPRLRHDFAIPALCATGRIQHTNAWLGPAGTVTPLHFDSYDNVLTQVFGYKRVRLYDASQTPWLYPKGAGGTGVDAQGNVSAVDIEAPDLDAHPDFARAVGTETVLGPGEGLFIPAGCWHHVRSLSPAFSISFWF